MLRALALSMLMWVSMASAQSVGAEGYACYRLGSPILVHFEYRGGIEGWDGWIVSAGRFGEKSLGVANGAYLAVSRGTQPFVPVGRGRYEYWELFEASRGELVAPRDGRVNVSTYNVALTEPFNTVVDITDYFEIDWPGVYTIYWGHERLCHYEIVFEVLPSDQVLGSDGEQVNTR